MPDPGTRPVLPEWAENLRQKYLVGEASVFILHGNVFDRYLVGERAHGLMDFLAEALLRDNKKHIYELSVDRGIRVLNADDSAGLADETKALAGYLAEQGPSGRFAALERRMREQDSVAVLIPYAGTVVPAGEPSFLSQDDRIALTTLHRWSLDDAFTAKDAIVILVSESLADVNQALLANPKIAAVEIAMPDLATREAAIRHYAKSMPPEQVRRLAEHTAGLRTVQLSSILAAEGHQGNDVARRKAVIESLLRGSPNAGERAAKLATITAGMTPEEIGALIGPGTPIAPEADPYAEVLEVVRKRKRELIEKECAGLIEFIEPRHGLEVVGGNEGIKRELMEIARSLKAGDRALAPMGLLAVGPMGAGKTFVIKAFLKEAGLSAVALKNFRSKWVGATESNLERVLTTVKAMGPIAVIIDEGDRSFGKGSEDNDGGTSSRVIARLKEFMSDTENRGRVLFILMTNRPDKLDTDIKRPGRLDRKIPFFYADASPERADIVRAILSRHDIEKSVTLEELTEACDQLAGYSNADLEAVALLAVEFARRAGTNLTLKAFVDAAEDFIPPREEAMVSFMEILAVSETSRRSMLPRQFREMSAEAIQQALQARKRAALNPFSE